MTSSFPEVDSSQVGFYVGIIASAFALAQFSTNFYWGWLSDRIGRKPVILTGTVLTSACFLAFGFCKTLGQAVAVQLLMGLVNGNQGVVSTCLGEITDRSNQSRAFVYLPVVYGLGGITGPILGGLLVSKGGLSPEKDPYPYLLPNIVAAAVLLVDLILTMAFLEESLEEARDLPPLGNRLGSLFAWLWQFTSSSRPSYLRKAEHQQHHHHHQQQQIPSSTRVSGEEGMDSDSDTDADSAVSSHASLPTFLPHSTATLKSSQVFNRDTILLLATYSIFQLSNISYNSLYPIFGQASPPTGRGLTPEEIGISLAFAGAATILFQIGIFGRIRDKMGNRITYRACLAGIVLAFMLTPWVGYKSKSKASQDWLYVELGVVLLIRSLAAVGCLTSALLLITNSAPNHSGLGMLNGLAQTLSAAGRAVGPFLSGGLFTLATNVKPKGEALAFGVFGGIAFIGFLMSFGIRAEELEGDGWEAEEGSIEEEEEVDDADIRRDRRSRSRLS